MIAAGLIIALSAGTAIWWVELGPSSVVTPKLASTVATAPATASAALPQNTPGSAPPTGAAITAARVCLHQSEID